MQPAQAPDVPVIFTLLVPNPKATRDPPLKLKDEFDPTASKAPFTDRRLLLARAVKLPVTWPMARLSAPP